MTTKKDKRAPYKIDGVNSEETGVIFEDPEAVAIHAPTVTKVRENGQARLPTRLATTALSIAPTKGILYNPTACPGNPTGTCNLSSRSAFASCNSTPAPIQDTHRWNSDLIHKLDRRWAARCVGSK